MNFYRTVPAGFMLGVQMTLFLLLSACEQTNAEKQLEIASKEGLPKIVRATFPDSEGKTFFDEQVLPKLAANGCTVCHMPGAGYVRPEISYDGLFPFLAIGQAADNNIIMFKMANQRSFSPDKPNHPGGKRCETEDTDPCKTIKTWWEVEFGEES